MLKDKLKNLCCPKCKNKIGFDEINYIKCEICNIYYPIINGIPILINEGNSVFSISDFVNQNPTFFKNKGNKIKNLLELLIPSITLNLLSKKNYSFLCNFLQNNPAINILVIGGSIEGEGFQELEKGKFNFIISDISLSPIVDIIFDAHDIPFENSFFDLVICQAVLEHVIDPYRVVQEIWRVLKPDGMVYAETPFMQQVHGREYDFTRFTYLGYRRLFRNFDELKSGILIGTGTSLVWSIVYFLRSLSNNKRISKILGKLGEIFFFWLKYFDLFTIRNDSCFDGASAFYFLGSKSNVLLSDIELIKLYKGG